MANERKVHWNYIFSRGNIACFFNFPMERNVHQHFQWNKLYTLGEQGTHLSVPEERNCANRFGRVWRCPSSFDIFRFARRQSKSFGELRAVSRHLELVFFFFSICLRLTWKFHDLWTFGELSGPARALPMCEQPKNHSKHESFFTFAECDMCA